MPAILYSIKYLLKTRLRNKTASYTYDVIASFYKYKQGINIRKS